MSDPIKTKIPAEMEPAAVGGMVTDAKYIIDRVKNKNQTEINTEVGTEITNIKGGSSKSIANLDSQINGNGGIDERLGTVEELAEISIGGGDAQIATGSDFTNPDATKRAKVPTVGAIIDGLNDGVYDVSKRNPTGGENSDGKFTLAYILANADTLIPTSWRHGGMTISFVDSSSNKYVQYRLTANAFTIDITKWVISINKVEVEDSEYIEAKTDSEGKILEGTKVDGSKDIYGGLQIYGDIKVPCATVKTLDSQEYLKVTTDSQGKILNGIKKDGSHYIHNVQSETLDDIKKEITFKLEPLTENYYTEEGNEEYIEAKIDSQGRVVESINNKGQKELNIPLSIKGNLFLSKDNSEYASAIVDSNEKVLAHFDKEGKLHANLADKKSGIVARNKWLGAFYFNGWSGVSLQSQAVTQEGRDLWANVTDADLASIGYPAKADAQEDWLDYVKRVDGEYPPSDCSFCLYFPEFAPSEYRNAPRRKPWRGWRYNGVTDMEEEIELASAHGIDFFVFCWFVAGGFVNGQNDFDVSRIHVDPEHPYSTSNNPYYSNQCIYDFLQARNNYKMKFCVMPLDNHVGNNFTINNIERLHNLTEYMKETFFSHPSYLHVNGLPLYPIYSCDHNLPFQIGCGNSKVITNFNTFESRAGSFNYAVGIPVTEPWREYPYSDLMERVLAVAENLNCYEVNAKTVMAGRDAQARSNYIEPLPKYTHATKEQFLSLLSSVESMADDSVADEVVIIYAWNEFAEGGWLPPCECDTTTYPNDYPILDRNGVQKKDANNRLLFYSFYKLEAIKEAKEKWIKEF